MQFKKDVARDACLVHASMKGAIMLAATWYDMTTNDVSENGRWLKTQSEAYIAEVISTVRDIERGQYLGPR